jgi:hypothetical protein
MAIVRPQQPLPNGVLQADDIQTGGGGNKYFIASGYISPSTNITNGDASVTVGGTTSDAPSISPGTSTYSFQMPYDPATMDNHTLTLDFDFDLEGGGTASTSYDVEGVQTSAAAKRQQKPK